MNGIISIKGVKGIFIPPKPLPFGAHKYLSSLRGDKIPNKGDLIGAVIFYEVAYKDGTIKAFTDEVTYR